MRLHPGGSIKKLTKNFKFSSYCTVFYIYSLQIVKEFLVLKFFLKSSTLQILFHMKLPK